MAHANVSGRMQYSGKPPLVFSLAGSGLPKRLGGSVPDNVADREVCGERAASGATQIVEGLQQDVAHEESFAAALLHSGREHSPSEPGPSPTPTSPAPTSQEQNAGDTNRCLAEALLVVRRKAGLKVVQKLLNALASERFSLENFISVIPDANALALYEEDVLRKNMSSVGFRQVELDGPGGTRCVMFTRDPVHLLQTQVRQTPTHQIITSPIFSRKMSHPLSAGLGREAEPAIRRAIQVSKQRHVYWRQSRVNGEQSFVGFAQLYSDKSQTSLKASSLHFYPLHATLHNFTAEARHSHITSGRSILAFLPVHFRNVSSSADIDRGVHKSKFYEVSRSDRIRSTHLCIETALAPLSDVAEGGFLCPDSSGIRWRCHVAIGSYCADIPEAKDLLSVRYGNITPRPCPRCFVKKGDMTSFQEPYDRTLQLTLSTQAQFHSAKAKAMSAHRDSRRDLHTAADNVLAEQSLNVNPPVLQEFPFMSLVPCLDIYSVFHFEPMHNLPLGVSKLLKTCAGERLRSDSQSSTAMLTTAGQPKKFATIRVTVLKEMNAFLSRSQQSSQGYGLRLDFSSGSGTQLQGLFADNGLCGMLEAKDYISVDQVSPFLGGIADRLCGESSAAPVTSVFTKYVDLYRFIGRRHMAPSWTADDIEQLKEMIAVLKEEGTKLFQHHQASGMATVKWHLLDHIPADICRLGGISFSDASLFEYSHIIFKTLFETTSRRHATAMSETVHRLEEQGLADEAVVSNVSNVHGSRVSPVKSRAHQGSSSRVTSATQDTTSIARSGPLFQVGDIAAAYNLLYKWRTDGGVGRRPAFQSEDLQKFCEWLGEDDLRAVVRLLEDVVTENSTDGRNHNTVRFQFPASGFVSSRPCPSLSDSAGRGREVFIPHDTRRVSVRIAAASVYYGMESPRRDDIMIQAPPDRRYKVSDGSTRVWFGRLLTFSRCCTDLSTNFHFATCDTHGVKSCGPCTSRSGEEYAIIQYYEVIGEDDLSIDGVDLTLNCIRLRWARADGEDGVTSSAKWYGFCPVDAILGKVHTVELGSTLRHLDISDRRRCQVNQFSPEGNVWERELFYVNRFYHTAGDTFTV